MSTSIEWTNETWNPLAGCSPVSEGCRNCYAAKEAIRLGGNPNLKISGKYAGTAAMRGQGKDRRAVFTGTIVLHEASLEEPLRWRQPRRVFVNSMSDLFHEKVPFDFIDRVFTVMALASQHTFQILTKRPERMADYCNALIRRLASEEAASELLLSTFPGRLFSISQIRDVASQFATGAPVNVWLGTSVENQAAADERIPQLLRTPAAVRFLSCEPLLGPLNVRGYLMEGTDPGRCANCGHGHGFTRCPNYGGVAPTWSWSTGAPPSCSDFRRANFSIGWLIVGGESGAGARGFNIRWARSLVEQGRAAGVPVFVKQLGAHPFDTEASARLDLLDRKGGHWHEWPEDLRVREYPEVIDVR